MLNIMSSKTLAPSGSFEEVRREGRETNLDWLARNIGTDEEAAVRLLLVGGRDLSSFRLRVAQSHLRHDMTPSHWSHVALLGARDSDIGATRLREISLDPPAGFGEPAPANHLQEAKLSRYRDRRRYPNLAVLRVPVGRETIERAITRYQGQRAVLDGGELVVLWLAYVWGAGRANNPLLDGYGIPSAAMVEVVMATAGYDLTPGLESRASCPEAIWQSAKWWHEYYDDQQRDPLSGAWVRDHELPG